MNSESDRISDLLQAVREGDRELQGKVLQRYEPWLRLVARVHMETRLMRKFDPTDMVQETLLRACRVLPQFRGATSGELGAFLKAILVHIMSHENRKYDARKRDMGREVRIDAKLNESTKGLRENLGAPTMSPSGIACETEQAVILARALDELSPDHREVIILRNMEGLSHEEVAERLGKSPGAVRMLWLRALAELKKILNRPERG